MLACMLNARISFKDFQDVLFKDAFYKEASVRSVSIMRTTHAHATPRSQ